MEKSLDNAILTLKRKGVLNYAGATEIQSIKEDDIPVLVRYQNFGKAIGQIWCQTFGAEAAPKSGKNTSANLRFIFFTAKGKNYFNIYLTRMPNLGNRTKMKKETFFCNLTVQ